MKNPLSKLKPGAIADKLLKKNNSEPNEKQEIAEVDSFEALQESINSSSSLLVSPEVRQFLNFRDNTIKKDTFKYEYSLKIELAYSGFKSKLDGIQTGIASYNKSSGIPYLAMHKNSGALFYDGFTTSYRKDNYLYLVKQNKKKQLIGYDLKNINPKFGYDYSTFAKAIFEYGEDQIQEILDVDDGKIEIIPKVSVGNVVSDTIKVLKSYNNSQLAQVINKISGTKNVASTANKSNAFTKVFGKISSIAGETSAEYHLFASYANEKIDGYLYSFIANIAGAQLNLSYAIKFIDDPSSISISEPHFRNLYLSYNDVNESLDKLKNAINSYKNQESSGYNFNISSLVEIPDSKPIKYSNNGETVRKIKDGEIYYLNKYSLEYGGGDLKNWFKYREKLASDAIKRVRVKLNNGRVYDLGTGLGIFNKHKEVKTPLSSDEFYAFIDFDKLLSTEYVQVVQLVKDKTGDVYSLVIKDEMISFLLDYVNSLFGCEEVLDGSLVLGKFDPPTLQSSNKEFSIVLKNDIFYSCHIVLNGTIDTRFEETEGLLSGRSDYSIKIDIISNNDGSTYLVPSRPNEIKS